MTNLVGRDAGREIVFQAYADDHGRNVLRDAIKANYGKDSHQTLTIEQRLDNIAGALVKKDEFPEPFNNVVLYFKSKYDKNPPVEQKEGKTGLVKAALQKFDEIRGNSPKAAKHKDDVDHLQRVFDKICDETKDAFLSQDAKNIHHDEKVAEKEAKKKAKAEVANKSGVPADENKGGVPADENKGGVPTDENKGGVPADENKGGVPTDENKGGVPADENKGGVPADENKGGKPTEENKGGVPTDENKGGKPTEENKGGVPADENKGGVPADENKGGAPAEENKGGAPANEKPVDNKDEKPKPVRKELTAEEMKAAEAEAKKLGITLEQYLDKIAAEAEKGKVEDKNPKPVDKKQIEGANNNGLVKKPEEKKGEKKEVKKEDEKEKKTFIQLLCSPFVALINFIKNCFKSKNEDDKVKEEKKADKVEEKKDDKVVVVKEEKKDDKVVVVKEEKKDEANKEQKKV